MNSPTRLASTLLAATVLASASLAQGDPKPTQVPKGTTVPATKLVAPSQPAQSPAQDQLVQKRADKLAKPVFKNAAWVLDYDAARAQAKKEGKLVLTYFTRSYAG